MSLKRYRIFISQLSSTQRQEVEDKMKPLCCILSYESRPGNAFYALNATEAEPGIFPPVDELKTMLGLPDECTIISLTGQ